MVMHVEPDRGDQRHRVRGGIVCRRDDGDRLPTRRDHFVIGRVFRELGVDLANVGYDKLRLLVVQADPADKFYRWTWRDVVVGDRDRSEASVTVVVSRLPLGALAVAEPCAVIVSAIDCRPDEAV